MVNKTKKNAPMMIERVGDDGDKNEDCTLCHRPFIAAGSSRAFNDYGHRLWMCRTANIVSPLAQACLMCHLHRGHRGLHR